ncbi:MAG: apolipoprotein N-acyltransferase [Acidobacteria bacterium]|nr:apolipoprotein N-acyltransferase [Acidobacteriota bacterium]
MPVRAARLAGGAGSGLLLLLAFPPIDQRWVAFLALVPLVLALRGARGRDGALAGAAFGLAFFGILLLWISYFGWLAWGALVLSQAAMLALFGWLGAWASGTGRAGRLAGVPLLWTGVEMLRTRWPLGGFAWGGLGYTQHSGPPLLPLARIGGVHLVSLALVVVAVLLAEAAAGEWAARKGRGPAARAWLLAAAALAGLPALLPMGLAGPAAGPPVDVAVVQGNVPRGTFHGARGPRRGPEDVPIIENHVRLSLTLASDPPDLVVWPENSVDRDPFAEPGVLAEIEQAIGAVRRPFLIGAILDVSPSRFRNSNLFFGADGVLVGRYDKLRLVPFGEYVPWPALRRWIPALAQIPYDGLAGGRPVVFDVPGDGRIGSLICFESTFPDLARGYARLGAEVIVVTTNNASFGDSPASRQHLAMSQVRAVEEGRAVVHAAISGISALVSPDGGIIARSPLFEPAILRARLPRAGGLTPYGTAGAAIESLIGIGAALAAGAGAAARARRRRGRATRAPEPAPLAGEGAAAPRACVVLPTYNEAGTIREVVARALASTPEADVLVVDDNSPDGTGRIADEIAAADRRVRVLHRAGKAGLGRAYLAGFAEALARGYAVVIEMDSDLSHDPGDVARFVAATREADLVVGSRRVPGGSVGNWGAARRLLSALANLYARSMLRFPLTDSTSGFRCYRREVLEAVPLDRVASEGYAFQIEMAWRAWTQGFRVAEIPIRFVERREGASKMSRRIVIEALWSVARWSLARRRPPRAPHLRSVAAARAGESENRA